MRLGFWAITLSLFAFRGSALPESLGWTIADGSVLTQNTAMPSLWMHERMCSQHRLSLSIYNLGREEIRQWYTNNEIIPSHWLTIEDSFCAEPGYHSGLLHHTWACQPRILHPEKLSFIKGDNIKTLQNRKNSSLITQTDKWCLRMCYTQKRRITVIIMKECEGRKSPSKMTKGSIKQPYWTVINAYAPNAWVSGNLKQS